MSYQEYLQTYIVVYSRRLESRQSTMLNIPGLVIGAVPMSEHIAHGRIIFRAVISIIQTSFAIVESGESDQKSSLKVCSVKFFFVLFVLPLKLERSFWNLTAVLTQFGNHSPCSSSDHYHHEGFNVPQRLWLVYRFLEVS